MAPATSLQELTTLLDQITDPMMACFDSEGRAVYVNECGCRFLNRSRSEILGKTSPQVHGKPSTPVHQLVTQVLEERKPISRDLALEVNGRQRVLEATVQYCVTGDGKEYALLVSRDVTHARRHWDQKYALQRDQIDRLQEEKGFLQNMLDHCPYAVLYASPDRTIQLVNKHFEKLWGYRADEVIGKNTDFLYAGGVEYPPVWDDRNEGSAGEQACEYQYRRKDGSTFLGKTFSPPARSENGSLMGYLKYTQDITEEKRIQKDLERNQIQLIHYAKMATLGEMAAGIAHEINNPLAILSSACSQLERAVFSGTVEPSWLFEKVQLVHDTVWRIHKIVKGLREFSRSGRSGERTPIPLHDVVSETLSFCSSRVRDRRVNLRISVPERLQVHASRVQLCQALLNLLTNALHAIEGQEDPWIEIAAHEGLEVTQLTVTDSGPGIPDPIRQRIMEPFFTTKPVGQGTGLGLSITRGLMEAQGGRLFLDTSHRNTRFVLEIPKTEAVEERNLPEVEKTA